MSEQQAPSVIANLKSEIIEAANKSFDAKLEAELVEFRRILLIVVANSSPRAGTQVTVTMSSKYSGMSDHVVRALRSAGINAQLRAVNTSYEYIIAVEIPCN